MTLLHEYSTLFAEWSGRTAYQARLPGRGAPERAGTFGCPIPERLYDLGLTTLSYLHSTSVPPIFHLDSAKLLSSVLYSAGGIFLTSQFSEFCVSVNIITIIKSIEYIKRINAMGLQMVNLSVAAEGWSEWEDHQNML